MDVAGNVYVADTSNQRIQKFTSDGTFLKTWGSAGTSDGQFQYPTGIAIDAAGNVYVADYFSHRIQKFTSDGTFQKT
ncbi:SMP-30/gluconolactonase/LRE family protein [Lysinibacillus sp. NPDC097231]|uniref:SMP-30/gluconolactonase/LRE family protein n=1 Tax=Lysinibacillus sp. NPDC097231 TaxID=3364142 RepID=UPI003800DC27